MKANPLPSNDELSQLFRLDSSVPSGLVWINPSSRLDAGNDNGTGHYQIRLNGSLYLTSRIIYQLANNVILQAEDVVDHIDGDPNNNDSSNLRIATKQQNCRNVSKHKAATSKYRGVSACSRKKTPWQATIQIDRKLKFLGRFKSEIEAAEAYDNAARTIDSVFYKTNF